NAANHPLHSPQDLYLRLRRRIFSIWDYMKNDLYAEEATNHKLIWISPLLGRRESRRVVGDYMLTQTDAEACRTFPDTVGICGHGLDYHPPSFDGGYECIFYSGPVPFDVPFRCIYSRNIENLFSAGRAISATHVAFSGTRIIRTGALLGQAAAVAASLCRAKDITPRSLANDHAAELQQAVIAQDAWIPGVALSDSLDLAATAHVTASSEATVNRDPDSVNGTWRPAGAGLGAVAYTYPERLTNAGVCVRNGGLASVSVRAFVGYGQSPLPEWPDVRERDADERYVFSPPVQPYWITRFDTCSEQELDIPAGFEGWVDVAMSSSSPFPPYDRRRFTQGVLVAVSGDVEVLVAPHGLDTIDVARSDGDGSWSVRPGPVPIVRMTPDPTPGAATHVTDGHIHRQALAHLHQWISAPGEALPQWLELDLGEPRSIGRIQLRFDTTERFWEQSYMAQGESAPRRCVRDYRIEVETPDGWQSVVEEKDNVLRFREHRLPTAIMSRKVRIIVDAVNGPDQLARIYSVHLYERRDRRVAAGRLDVVSEGGLP
ncbi:MAG: FAD-dependent oxidoreductase, partial [Lentisphaerae bacterium]|nr:FAD-dependent oxidoreductase [Lentisphaerota bacterium]